VNQEQLVGISNTSRITPADAVPARRDVFGPEPVRSWCYYFQRADLARQLGEWDEILDLEREASQLGYSAGFGPELIPFIEAHARKGDWRGALDLSREAQETVSEMEPLLCSTWARLGQVEAADASLVQAARYAFGCQNP
jgi:hypothetical protein